MTDRPSKETIIFAALEAALRAMTDWTRTYASEFCDPEHVEETMRRMEGMGTIGYIDHVAQQIRGALALMSANETTGCGYCHAPGHLAKDCSDAHRDALDAARYRFLRQRGNAIVYAKHRHAWGQNASGHVAYDTAEQLDAAVDAAMEQSPEEPPAKCNHHQSVVTILRCSRCGKEAPEKASGELTFKHFPKCPTLNPADPRGYCTCGTEAR